MPNFFQKFRDFVLHPTHSRIMGILIFFVLIVAVSLTVIVSQQQQQIRQRASSVCEDTSIQECPSGFNGDCVNKPTFQCKITNGDKYDVYGCVKE